MALIKTSCSRHCASSFVIYKEYVVIAKTVWPHFSAILVLVLNARDVSRAISVSRVNAEAEKEDARCCCMLKLEAR